MSPYAHITGWGMSVPSHVVTNEELAKKVDTSDQWIRERTGIRERHIAGAEDTTASLAVEAALKALRVANLNPDELDIIVPANDDAIRAVKLICVKIADAVIEGKGIQVVMPKEEVSEEEAAKEVQPAPSSLKLSDLDPSEVTPIGQSARTISEFFIRKKKHGQFGW